MANTEIIQTLLKRLRDKNQTEYDHALRVQEVVDRILSTYDLPAEEKQMISEAAVLHDIGNLALSDTLLYKPGRLSVDEYVEVQSHVTLHQPLIEELENAEAIGKLIRHHHENINGFGYPDGLEGNEIPLGSRIIHVAEAFDSMHVNRHEGKVKHTVMSATQELQKFAGTMYDSDVIKHFMATQSQASDVIENTNETEDTSLIENSEDKTE